MMKTLTFLVVACFFAGEARSQGPVLPSELTMKSGTLARLPGTCRPIFEFYLCVDCGTGQKMKQCTSAGWEAFNGPVPYTSLTDAATVTIASAGAGQTNSILALDHTIMSRTLVISGLVSGSSGVLILKQDSTGGALTVTLPAGSKVHDGGSGAIAVTTTGLAVDAWSWFYDGTTLYWNSAANYN